MGLYSHVRTGGVMLSLGTSGYMVRELQQLLGITVDGEFGPQTDRALRQYQQKIDLVADGIAGPKVMTALRGDSTLRLLRHTDIERAAADLGVSVAAVLAVNEVESRGSGFLQNGDPAILFERHIMQRLLKAKGVDTGDLEKKKPNLVNQRPGGYKGGALEHERLDKARKIDAKAAVKSASWGLFQIMGFHYSTLGYTAPATWEAAMRRSEGDHLIAFVRFIRADHNIHQALRDLDWTEFARRYNGPGYAKNQYDTKMAEAYDRHAAAV